MTLSGKLMQPLPRLAILISLAVHFVTAGMASPAMAAPLTTGTPVGASAQAAFEAVPSPMARSVALAEPLIRTAPTTPQEDQALAQALSNYKQRSNPDDLSSLQAYVSQYPHSGWTAAAQTDLGLAYLHDGYFSKATLAWQAAWAEGRGATGPQSRAVVDRAVGELARLYASLGQFDKLTALFKDIDKRPITGSATEAVQEARETLSLVNKDPRHLFNCGPMALKFLMLALDPKDQRGSTLQWYHAGPKGTSLAEVAGLADKTGFAYRLVSRQAGQPVPYPAVIHWTVGHFSAITGMKNGRYHIEDPIFAGDGLWVTQAALDSEASGYFLVPAGTPDKTGWRAVKVTEAGLVWGKGPTNGTRPGDAGDRKANGNPSKCPMCSYDIKEATVGLTLSDLPVGYTPPIGPSTTVRITYNQREDSQPAAFNFFNVSPKWTLNWLTYITDDPTNLGANVSRYLPNGGAYYYKGYSGSTGQFTAQDDDGSILVLASASPASYRLQSPDGSTEIYAQSDASTSYPRKIFLSQVIDPQGNAVTLSYDGQMRLSALTDATGRQTTFNYALASQPLLVTKVTDPFGRSAALTYDASGRLSSITDIIGLTSSFAYDANSLVDSMTTPYGTSTFSYTAPGTSGPPRFVEATDPLGYHEREEWLEPAAIPDSDPSTSVPQGMPLTLTNQFLDYRDSFHWDKSQYVAAGCTATGGCDYSKARDTHFLHVVNTTIKSTSVESIKYPLENRIWYNYPGQTQSIYDAPSSQPSAIGRVLDDGTTQLSQFSYDTAGYYRLTQATDEVGRVTNYAYANQIDLVAISQTTALGAHTTIAQFTYNTHHRPIFSTDAAGQPTTYAYNAAGQRTSVTNPLNQTTTNHYDSTGDLTSVTNANGLTQASYTYDAYDRVATSTDSEGWTVAFAYDNADRPTKTTYPDGTTKIYTYDKLDLATYQDRLGRIWTYTHDANRRLTAITDPLGHQMLFAYNPTDQVTSRTDPKGNVTQWAYDIEGRLTTKTYADSTTNTSTYEATTSRLKTTTDALGQIKSFTYAPDNKIIGISYTNAVNATPNVTFSYDPYYPLLSSMTDGAGTTQYNYNPAGSAGALQAHQTVTPLTTIAYAYDALGRLNARTVNGSGAETMQYDAIGRMTGDTNDLGAFTLGYLGQTGQLTSRQLASSTLATAWTYLPNSGDRRLASIGTIGLSSSEHSTFQYTTDAGNFTTAATQTSDAAIAYPPTALAQTASYNTLNQLTTLSSQALTYDADGNLLTDGTRSYSWDAENRLVGITYPGQSGKATGFAYDGLGRRISISSTPVGGGTTLTSNYTWCGWAICQARDSGGSVTRAYYSEGEYVAGSPGQALYYAPDQNGSVRRVYTSGQAPTYDYDPYGNSLQGTAQLTDYTYAGTFYNADSGLYLTTNRAYDPVAGRFLSRDPIGEDGDAYGNLYGYAGGNPITYVDPSGLFCWPDFRPLLNNPLLALAMGITIAAGGGPEDPIGDAAAAAEFAAFGGEGAAAAEVGAGEAAESDAVAASRLPQDVAVNPTAPDALPLDRPIGLSPSQNLEAQNDIAQAQAEGASDFRVNQQQVDASGDRVGTNRPDLQYTDANGNRVYTEYDTPSSTRGPGHEARITANDPNGTVILKTVK